ncbi:LOW QUALITY PROTEIN: hypothetical protein KUTeg_003147 [Tegillarca granosa]|uniref:Uncharacterized protein n=1 Tax=Tegillarca granosa TaxID=220873 RepID=A0ABQ9FPH3_TEGGR|nr:LOW QUALITY PROTEIN: hypothetical protein KUTeg_003147 [Tegillarca granosa]
MHVSAKKCQDRVPRRRRAQAVHPAARCLRPRALPNLNDVPVQTDVPNGNPSTITDEITTAVLDKIQQHRDSFQSEQQLQQQILPIVSTAYPHSITGILKYIHTIRLGASRSSGDSWKTYDIQFRLRKFKNPEMSWAVVDQELWLLYMSYQHNSTITKPVSASFNKSYDYNYKAFCSKKPCTYSHLCIRCSQTHPHLKCKSFLNSDINPRFGQQTRQRLPAAASGSSDGIKSDLVKRAETPIRPDVLENLIRFYPNQSDANLLVDGFTNGFKLNYHGPHVATDCQNLRSVFFMLMKKTILPSEVLVFLG